MTIFFPDVSSYTPNVDPAQYPVLIARATLSDRVSDPTYGTFRAKSTAAGTLFVAYHWLNHGNLAAQAKWAFQHVGPDVPLMIDAEDEPGNTGYNGSLTVDDLLGFAAEYRALGGTASLAYLPHWYWQGAMGSPDLRPLQASGLGLVASNYPSSGYTENGPGWAGYGGVDPVQWQYTSTPIDMNAFRGTVDEFRALVGSAPAPPPEEIMGVIAKDDKGQYYHCTGGVSYPIDAAAAGDVRYLASQGVCQLATGPSDNAEWTDGGKTRLGWNPTVFGPVYTPSASADPAAVAAALTQEQLVAAFTAAGITPEAVADALAQHFHVS